MTRGALLAELAPKPRRRTVRVGASETALHMEVVRFLRFAWPRDLLVYHCPNGELRDPRTAGKLKAMGVLAGVADLAFHLPKGRIGYIELKTADGEQTADQVAFGRSCEVNGQGYAVCRSLAEVETVLSGWLAKFDRKLCARVSA